jgi:hypothetical protein
MRAHKDGYVLSDAECEFSRKSYEGCTAFIAICAALTAVLQAGLVEGKTVTGPRPMLDSLRKSVPWSQLGREALD